MSKYKKNKNKKLNKNKNKNMCINKYMKMCMNICMNNQKFNIMNKNKFSMKVSIYMKNRNRKILIQKKDKNEDIKQLDQSFLG